MTSVTVDDSGGDGIFVVSVVGAFPASMGTLLVSSSSTQGVSSNINTTGTIDSWTTSQIDFTVQTFNVVTGVLDGDDFSFVLLGS